MRNMWAKVLLASCFFLSYTWSQPAAAQSSLLDAASLQRSLENLDRAIDLATDEIATLESSIKTTDAQIQLKVQEIDYKMSEISQRERELERQRDDDYNRALLCIALTGNPELCGILALNDYFNRDSRLQDLKRQRDYLQSERAQLATQMQAYLARKTTLSAQLVELRREEQTLQLLVNAAPRPVDGLPREITTANDAVFYRGKLLDNLSRQKTILLAIRALGLGLEAQVDSLLGQVDATLESARRAIDASRGNYLDLVAQYIVDGEAGLTLEDFTAQLVNDRVKALRARLNLDVELLVDRMLAQHFVHSSSLNSSQLRAKLITLLRSLA